MPKTIIHSHTGEFRDHKGRVLVEGISQGWTEVGCPSPSDASFSVVEIPVGIIPDTRTQKWNGSAVVDKTAGELTAYDAAQPLWIDGREVMRRLAASTHLGLERLSQTDATVCKLWNTLKAGGNVNVHSAEFTEGAAYLRTVGIPSVWPDVAAFDAERLAQDTA